MRRDELQQARVCLDGSVTILMVVTMDRQEIEAHLVEYLYDELDAGRRVAFEGALERFPELAAEVRAHARTRSLYAGFGDERAPQRALNAATRAARQALTDEESGAWWAGWGLPRGGRARSGPGGGWRWAVAWLTHPGFAVAALLLVVAAMGLHVANLGETPSRYERVMAPPTGAGAAGEAQRASRAPLEGALKGRAADEPARPPAPAAGSALVSAGGGEGRKDRTGAQDIPPGYTTTARAGEHAAVGGRMEPPGPPALKGTRAPAKSHREPATKSLIRGLAQGPARGGSAGAREKTARGGAERGPASSRGEARRPKARRATGGLAGLGKSALRDETGVGMGEVAAARAAPPAAAPSLRPRAGAETETRGEVVQEARAKPQASADSKGESQKKSKVPLRAREAAVDEARAAPRGGGSREDGARLYAKYKHELAAGRMDAAEALLVVLERIPGWRAKARVERKRLQAKRAAARQADEGKREAQGKASGQKASGERAAGKKAARNKAAAKKSAEEKAAKKDKAADSTPAKSPPASE